MNDLTIMLNTHSSCADLWPMFFGQLNRYWPSRPPCIVASDGFPEFAGEPAMFDVAGDAVVDYSPAKRFTSQYLMGLCAVETPYVLTMQEDFLLYHDVDVDRINSIIYYFENSERLICHRLIDAGRSHAYSMQASIWRTTELKKVYAMADFDAPWEAEVGLCKFVDHNRVSIPEVSGPKRGRDHFDSTVFPYTATALCRGSWNAEYRTELEPLHAQYGIDASKRGWTECRS